MTLFISSSFGARDSLLYNESNSSLHNSLSDHISSLIPHGDDKRFDENGVTRPATPGTVHQIQNHSTNFVKVDLGQNTLGVGVAAHDEILFIHKFASHGAILFNHFHINQDAAGEIAETAP